jgi:hypothetical protein
MITKNKTKRLIAFVIAIALAFSTIPQSAAIKANATKPIRDWSIYSYEYSYTKMNANEKALYSGLNQVCNEFISSEKDAKLLSHSTGEGYYLDPVLSKNLSNDQIKNVVALFVYEHPQYYFTKPTFLTGGEGDNINVYLYCYEDFAIGSERSKITDKIFSGVDEAVTSFNGNSLDTVALEKAVHDYVCKTISYGSNGYDQSIYSAFVLKQTVCNGYCKAVSLLLNAVGIPSVIAASGPHTWNKVCIKDKWYTLDATWDDQVSKTYYNFFNKSDEDIKCYDQKNEHDVQERFVPYLPVAETSMSGDFGPIGNFANIAPINTTATTEANATTTKTPATTEAIITPSTTESILTPVVTTEAKTTKATATTEKKANATTEKKAKATTTEAKATIPKPTITFIKGYKGYFRIKFAKATGKDYYTMYYSTDKNFAKNFASVKIPAGYNGLKVTNVLGNKKYYVKMRRVQYIGKKRYTSKWSKVKTVKVK